jgi:hypothetical protein
MLQRNENLSFGKMTFAHPLPRQKIEDGFAILIGENRLFGAHVTPDFLKKEFTRKKFLVSRLPRRKKLYSIWMRLFRDLVSPTPRFITDSIMSGR